MAASHLTPFDWRLALTPEENELVVAVLDWFDEHPLVHAPLQFFRKKWGIKGSTTNCIQLGFIIYLVFDMSVCFELLEVYIHQLEQQKEKIIIEWDKFLKLLGQILGVDTKNPWFTRVFVMIQCPLPESNQQLLLRRELLYPLN